MSAHWVIGELLQTLNGREYIDVVHERVVAPAGVDRLLGPAVNDRDFFGVRLPGGSRLGLLLGALIRGELGLTELPIIAFTAGVRDDQQAAARAGFRPHLQYPIAGLEDIEVVLDDSRARAAVVTEIHEGWRQRVGRISVLGGEGFRHWRHLIAELEMWAKAQGANRMEIMGRDWSKVLGRDGYVKTATVVRKPL